MPFEFHMQNVLIFNIESIAFSRLPRQQTLSLQLHCEGGYTPTPRMTASSTAGSAIWDIIHAGWLIKSPSKSLLIFFQALFYDHFLLIKYKYVTRRGGPWHTTCKREMLTKSFLSQILWPRSTRYALKNCFHESMGIRFRKNFPLGCIPIFQHPRMRIPMAIGWGSIARVSRASP